jgi:hypothetical protein
VQRFPEQIRAGLSRVGFIVTNSELWQGFQLHHRKKTARDDATGGITARRYDSHCPPRQYRHHRRRLFGLAAAIRFDQASHDDFLVFERGSDVGGTWRDNTYRGGMHLPSTIDRPAAVGAIGGRNGAAPDSRGGTGTWIPASGCNDASTAAAVHDALCGSTAITTRSLPDWMVIDTYANLF